MDKTVQRIVGVRSADRYTKKDAAAISAVAILLMVAHHFFGFRSYLAPGVEWHSILVICGIEIERIVAAFGKICVAVFAFNSGYVLWKLRDKYSDARSRYHRCLKFLGSYWIIFALFMAYAAIAAEPMPEGKELVLNFIGLATGPGMPYFNVSFAWYVAYYVSFLLLAPVLVKLFSGNMLKDIILIILSIVALNYVNIDFLSPLVIGLEGIFFAKYGLFERMARSAWHIRARYIPAIIMLLVVLRQGAIWVDNQWLIRGADCIAVPIFIFLCVSLFRKINIPFVEKIMQLLSVSAMNIWFIHGFYFTGSCPLQSFIYYTQNPPLIFLSGIALSVAVAMLIKPLQHVLVKCINRVL